MTNRQLLAFTAVAVAVFLVAVWAVLRASRDTLEERTSRALDADDEPSEPCYCGDPPTWPEDLAEHIEAGDRAILRSLNEIADLEAAWRLPDHTRKDHP